MPTRFRAIATVVVTMAVAFGGLVALDVSSTSPAIAADGAEFDPGYIVSDENFYDGAAMSASQVQDFLSSKSSGCASSSPKCLVSYSQSTPSMPASTYCQAYEGRPNGESAASILARVGQACGISQRVLLVLLQKEQSLVTTTSPSWYSYNAATGFGCPDTAPCDASFGGFFYQVYYAARQFRIYQQWPDSYNYRPGRWNTILWHPSASCGTSSVYIQNAATAALYIYTPYRPNAAALSNLYGVGDACSSYGNRNFWRLWSDWFGSPTETSTFIARLDGSDLYYLVAGGVKYPISSTLQAWYLATTLGARTLSPSALDAYTELTAMNGVVRTNDGRYFLLDRVFKFQFMSCDQVKDIGRSCTTAPVVGVAFLDKLVSGGTLSPLVQNEDGSLWLLQQGRRRQVTDASLLSRYGVTWTSPLSKSMIESLPVGVPVTGNGLVTDGTTTLLIAGSSIAALPATVASAGLTSRAARLRTESIALLSASGTVPARIQVGGRPYVLTSEGWLQVTASPYSATGFPAGDAALLTSLGTTAVPSRPYFVREGMGGQTYLISGSVRQHVADDAARNWLAAYFGLDAKLWILAPGAFDDGALPNGTVVSLASGVGIVDQGRLFRFSSCADIAALGIACTPTLGLSEAEAGLYADGGAFGPLVLDAGGTYWLVQVGTRREVTDPTILHQYGVTRYVSVASATIAAIPVGVPVNRDGVLTDGTRWILVNGAGAFSLSAAQAVGAVAASARRVTPATLDSLSPVPLPTLVQTPSRTLVLTADGWVQVSATNWTPSRFTSLSATATSGIVVSAVSVGPNLVREWSKSEVTLMSGGEEQPIFDAGVQSWVVRTFGVDARVYVVPDGTLVGSGLPVGSVVRGTGDVFWLIDGSGRYSLTGCDRVADLGFDCTAVTTATATQLAHVPDRGALGSVVALPDGSMWLMQDGARREVRELAAVRNTGLPVTVSTLRSDSVILARPIGVPVLSTGVYTDGAQTVLVNSTGVVRIPDAAATGAIQTSATRLEPGSIAQLGVNGVLPLRMRAGDRELVLTADGWLSVTEDSYGAWTFINRPDTAWVGLPIVGSVAGAHFAREASSSSIYLISGGTGQLVADSDELAWISAYFGVPSKVYVVADGVVSGSVLVTTSVRVGVQDGLLYLIDRGARYQLNCSQATELGVDCATVRPIGQDELASFANGGEYTGFVVTPDGRQWLVQSGTRREVPIASALAPYGITTPIPVSSGLVDALPVGQPVLAAGLYSDGSSRVVVVSGAGMFDLPAAAAAALRGKASSILPLSMSSLSPAPALPLRMSSSGRSFVLTVDGWLEVTAGSYGAQERFSALAPTAWSGIPIVRTQLSPHFARESSAATVYLMSGGPTAMVDVAQQNAVSAYYGVENRVWILVDGALSDLP